MRFAIDFHASLAGLSRRVANVHESLVLARSTNMLRNSIQRAGNLRWGLIALLLGLPLPIVLLVWLFVGR
jgi:hypothetical protein